MAKYYFKMIYSFFCCLNYNRIDETIKNQKALTLVSGHICLIMAGSSVDLRSWLRRCEGKVVFNEINLLY